MTKLLTNYMEFTLNLLSHKSYQSTETKVSFFLYIVHHMLFLSASSQQNVG